MQIIKKSSGFLLFCLVFNFIANAQDSAFRVVGYTRNQPNLFQEVKHLDLKRITHLNIAFINPDSTGNILIPGDLKKVSDYVHKRHIKVLISIAGGSPPDYLPIFLAAKKQAGFIAALTRLTVDNNLDGIDVDLEGRMIDSSYESFVTSLASALRAKNKLITAAVAIYYADRYTGKSLAQFDFINVMSYDKTGPWNQQKPGQHAPYEMAVSDIDYWLGRGIDKQKISLGLPFYGYGFGPDAPPDMSYRDIIARFPGAEHTDQQSLPGGGTIYYNGAYTIRAKTQLALQRTGGVMIWQLLQDAKGKKALLRIIEREIKSEK